jgi:hypothetical protein
VFSEKVNAKMPNYEMFTRLKRVYVFYEFRKNAIMEEKWETKKVNATTPSADRGSSTKCGA